MHMVSYKCARIVGLPLNMKGGQGFVQGFNKGALLLVEASLQDFSESVNFSLLYDYTMVDFHKPSVQTTLHYRG
jgi:hypothetical protein